MSELDYFEDGMTMRAWDCGTIPATSETPPFFNASRYGNSDPLQLPPVPDGCEQITSARYWELRGEVSQARDAWYAEWEANHPAGAAAVAAATAQAEDDRIADLVAVKVAEALAARGDA